jgi:ATP-dependent RNA helicase DDX24/MAK5
VIHYQVPKTTENYVHRSGRTARANNEGIAVLMMEPKEVRDYVRLHQNLGRSEFCGNFFLLNNFNVYFIAEEDLPLFPVSDQLMGAVRKRVVLAREIELLDHRTRKESNREFYDKKTAKEGDFDDFSPDFDSYVYLLSVCLSTVTSSPIAFLAARFFPVRNDR